MLRFLQKRKFRLVTRWKFALKENIGSPLPAQSPFPYMLIFRAFDEVVRMLKFEPNDPHFGAHDSFLCDINADISLSADQYMELFLTGRDILGDFIEGDSSFCALYSADDRESLRAALEAVFKTLIDREMREHARRFSSGVR
jgi:hypothetical protein